MSKPSRPTNEVPPDSSKTATRSAEATQAPGQEKTQTAGDSAPDSLAPWRQSLDASKRLSSELERLVSVRTTLSSETTALNLEIIKVCDAGIAEPARRAELASQLDPLVRDQSRLEHELVAANRGLDKTITELQKNLLDGSYGWSVLARRYQDDVLERQILQLLSGAQDPNDAMRSGAAELAKGSQAVRDAAKFSAVSSVSFAWSRPVTPEVRDAVLETIRTVSETHQRLAGELLPLCATLISLPPFEEPEKAPPESHLDWLEPLNADQSLVDRLIEQSGKKRSELSEEQLSIVIRSASGHNSYLREIQNPADRYAVGSQP